MNTATSEAKLHFLDYWRVIRVRLPLIILTFLLVVITTGVVTYFMPRQYESSVTIEVQQDDTKMAIFDRESGRSSDPRFAATQFQIIQKKEILYPVIDSLNLLQKWGERYGLRSKDQVYRKLRRMLDVREVRNTDLLEISVLSPDKEEAADIANTVAKEYARKRIGEEQRYTGEALTQLEDEVAKQEKVVTALGAEASRIRTEFGIVDLAPDTMQDPQQAQERVLMDIEQQVNQERLKFEQAKARYDLISKMTDDQIMRGTRSLEIEDPTILQTLPLYSEAESTEARLLNSGFGPNHPNVKSVRAQKDVYQAQLKAQIDSLRKTLKSNYEIAAETLKKLEAKVQSARGEQIEDKTQLASYAKAKGDYIEAKKILEAARMRLSTQTMERKMPRSPAMIWQKAEPAEFPARPRVWLNLAIGIVAGGVLGLGLAFFIEYLDTSVKTMEDVETYLQVPVLAVIPKEVPVLMHESPDHPDAEAYRILRTNIEFNRKSADANTITMVSGGSGEGKSTTINNLAYIFARGGYNTLIVDADLRRPSQHRLFEVSNEFGLTNFLSTDLSLEEVIQSTKVENLFFLPSGRLPLDAVGILNSQRMVDLISEVKNRFDVVFFDSPPILGVSDGSVLVSAVDLTAIVVQHRRFPRAMLQRVKQAILSVGGNILGVVLNNVDVRHDQYYEYYTSYYGYYSTPVQQKTRRRGDKKESAGVTSSNGSNDDAEY